MKIWKALTERGPVNWFRRLFHVVRVYGNDVQYIAGQLEGLSSEVQDAMRYIKRATKVHADVNYGEDGVLETTVILCGRYRGKDYVQTFRLPASHMEGIVEKFKHMERAAQIAAVDVPVGLDAVVKRELKT